MSKFTWFSRNVRKRFRPVLLVEALEDRCVPATCTPNVPGEIANVPGQMSLRDAIAASNMDQGGTPDIISIPKGAYVLTRANPVDPNTHQSLQDNTNQFGDLDIFSNKHKVTIRGTVVGGVIQTTIAARWSGC